MGDRTGIQWTEATWNPVTGCDAVSAGCDHCYAKRQTERFPKQFPNGFGVTVHWRRFMEPFAWTRPRMIFVCSMADLFHKAVRDETLDAIFDVMEAANWHRYQILTKRSSRMRDYINARYPGGAPKHLWLGVSIEDSDALVRLRHLQQTRAWTRMLSLEPLLGPLPGLDLTGIHWVIVGGESGPGWREMDPAWVRDIRDQCIAAGVAFFFKQWSGFQPEKLGRMIDMQEWNEYPE